MKKVELDIIALSHSITQSNSYAIVLGEKEGNRRLPIVIGGFEAQSIAVAIEKMTPSRPLTHDLMQAAFDKYQILIKEIVIDDLVDGVFYAKLICSQNGGEDYKIDSRTSDALALAVRFKCPIYTYEFIMDSAGIILEDPNAIAEDPKDFSKEKPKTNVEEEKKPSDQGDLAKMSMQELDERLQYMLSNERYEEAVKYRDEISRRKQDS